MTSGVFPPSDDSAGDGGDADLAILEAAEAAPVKAEAEEEDPVDDADASRLLCARHAV